MTRDCTTRYFSPPHLFCSFNLTICLKFMALASFDNCNSWDETVPVPKLVFKIYSGYNKASNTT